MAPPITLNRRSVVPEDHCAPPVLTTLVEIPSEGRQLISENIAVMFVTAGRRRRYDRHHRTREPSGMTPPTQEYLTHLLDTIERDHRAGRTVDDQLSHFVGGLDALRMAGLVSWDEQAEWVVRAARVSGRRIVRATGRGVTLPRHTPNSSPDEPLWIPSTSEGTDLPEGSGDV